MLKKYSISTLCFLVTLLIIFYVTYFNQQRYYEIQEKNRSNAFEVLLAAKSETNKVCLQYSTQEACYQNFISGLEKLNPRGSVQLTDSNGVVKNWDNEGHKDDRLNLSVSKTFSEFSAKPTVTLSKLTRHENLYRSSFNAMFFSVLDYAAELEAQLKGLPSTFGDMDLMTFTKYIAWGRFYPILPIWIIALCLLGYILSLVFKNFSFVQSIKNLKAEISDKEENLKKIYHERNDLKSSLDQLNQESNIKLLQLNNEKAEIQSNVEALKNKLTEINNEKGILTKQIDMIEKQNQKNDEDKSRLQNLLLKQKTLVEEINKKNQQLEQDNLEKSNTLKEFEVAKQELVRLETLYSQSRNKEEILSNDLHSLHDQMQHLNAQLTDSELHKNQISKDLTNKDTELNQYIDMVSNIENQYKQDLDSKNKEVEFLKSGLSELQTHKEHIQHELDKLSGADSSGRKIYNILVNNPDMPISTNYEYSEPEHHSKAYLKSIQNSFKSQKNYKIGNLITDLRGTKFNSKTPNTLRIVENYAVSPDISRSGFGLVAIEKNHGYAAYIHLTARNSSEAMLAAKAIQTYCSVFKGYRILPLSE